jgi:hypothetical protein
VDVHFLVYRDTLQADALRLVARGILAACMVDGDITPDGHLAASDNRGDLVLELARAVTEGSRRQDLGDLLRAASDAARAQAALVGGGRWTPPVATAPESARVRPLQQIAAKSRAEQIPLFPSQPLRP